MFILNISLPLTCKFEIVTPVMGAKVENVRRYNMDVKYKGSRGRGIHFLQYFDSVSDNCVI